MDYLEIAEKAKAVVEMSPAIMSGDHFVAIFEIIASHECHERQSSQSRKDAIAQHEEALAMLHEEV